MFAYPVQKGSIVLLELDPELPDCEDVLDELDDPELADPELEVWEVLWDDVPDEVEVCPWVAVFPLVVVDDVPVNVVATFEEVADVPEPDPDDVPEPDPDELDDPDPDELDDPVVEPADEVTRPKLKGVIGPVSCPWL